MDQRDKTLIFIIIILISLAVALAIFSNSTEASNLNIGGYLEVQYNLGIGTGLGIIDLHLNYSPIKIGIEGISELAGFGKRGFIPTGIPLNQKYTGYIELGLTDNFTIGAKTWCKHWFTQSGKDDDEGGITLISRYSF